jgi:hypothetical protein
MAHFRSVYDIHVHSGIVPGGGDTAIPTPQI